MNGSSSQSKRGGSSSSLSAAAVSSSDSHKGHAVERSKELLACANTAWKLYQRSQPPPPPSFDHDGTPIPPPPPPPPPTFRLADTTHALPSLGILEDGLALLRAMEYSLNRLQVLVRRRGHTNDPTREIATFVSQLEQDTNELTEFCKTVLARNSSNNPKRRRSKQDKKHWEYVVQWFQQCATRYGTQLQECLKVRGDVLAEQARQRKKISNGTGTGGTSSTSTTTSSSMTTKKSKTINTATPLFDSPLFTAPPPLPQRQQQQPQQHQQANAYNNGAAATTNGTTKNGATVPAKSTTTPNSNPYARNQPPAGGTSSYYGGGTTTGGTGGYGGGGYGGADGYGGGYGGMTTSTTSASMGMRNRKGGGGGSGGGGMTSVVTSDYDPYQNNNNNNANNNDDDDDNSKVHAQIQQRAAKRQTQQRLDEAQQAETKLGELGQLFGKMSTLISDQGEQLEKIEDDVEAAQGEVLAGQEELTKLYGIKKGNRPLIIKTFCILNFLIIFLRAYKK